MLDQYRLTFAVAYGAVVEGIRTVVGLEPTGRPAKSTKSIVDKLKRESVRLSQMQDIAGCRLVVSGIDDQNIATKALLATFGNAALVVDRRALPSFGYRAVHIIVRQNEQPIEIQIRTELQHLWAELSEKISDVREPGIKYGVNESDLSRGLLLRSKDVAAHELEEEQLRLQSVTNSDPAPSPESDDEGRRFADFSLRKLALIRTFEELVRAIPQRRGGEK